MTTDSSASIEEVPKTTKENPAKGHSKVAKICTIIALVLMVCGSLLARGVNTSWGAVTVTEITIPGADGQTISATLYTPATAAATSPAPAIAMWHGLNNDKNFMQNTALEFARRGYVVVSADQTGHGSSSGSNTQSGCGGADTLTYLSSLAIVNPKEIGLIGMSQGGFCAATAAAMTEPTAYQSIFYMESEVNAPGAIDVSGFVNSGSIHNAAFNIGTWTEMGVMIFVDKGNNAVASPVLLPFFGLTPGTDVITPNKVYGSISAGTARILYLANEDHALSTDSTAAIGNAISWMEKTVPATNAIDAGNQVWPLKFFGTALALVGAFMFLFSGGALLLRTKAFAGAVKPLPEFKGFSGAKWWIGAVITAAVGPLLYLWVWKHMFQVTIPAWMNVNSLWSQTFTNIYMVWTVIVAAITWLLIWFNHRFITKKAGATFQNYGVTEEKGKIDWKGFGKSVLLVVAILAPIIAILTFTAAVWHVDFRAWMVYLTPLTPARWVSFFVYLVPFATYFFGMAIILGGFLRWRKGKAPMWQEMLVNSVIMTIGTLIWLLLFYVPLMAGGDQIFGSDPQTSTSAGMGGIYYIPLLVLWPLCACLFTFFYRKTGRIYVGATITTALVVYSLVQAGVFGVAPIIG